MKEHQNEEGQQEEPSVQLGAPVVLSQNHRWKSARLAKIITRQGIHLSSTRLAVTLPLVWNKTCTACTALARAGPHRATKCFSAGNANILSNKTCKKMKILAFSNCSPISQLRLATEPDAQRMQRLRSSLGASPASHGVQLALPEPATEPMGHGMQISLL
jgi:hypothetical protein